MPSSMPEGIFTRERALAADAARSGAVRARIGDDLAAAVAVRAGALDRKEALRGTDTPVAVAGRAHLWARAGLRAGPGTHVAGEARGHANFGGLAGERFLQRDFHVVAQIRTALAAAPLAAAASAAHEVAEDVVEDVRHGRGEVTVEAAARSTLEGGMTEAVIRRATLRVLEAFVGLADFPETDFGGVIAGVAIGMKLHRELAVARLEARVVAGADYAQHLVEVALAHAGLPRPETETHGVSCSSEIIGSLVPSPPVRIPRYRRAMIR